MSDKVNWDDFTPVEGDAQQTSQSPVDWSQFEEVKPSGAIRRIADQGIKLAQGIVGVPEAAVGVADLVTGGHAGKLAESAGFRPKEAKQILGEYLSPEQKAADSEVAKAEGFFPTLGAMARNPSTIVGGAVESAPSMILGGAASRGLLAVAPKIGAIAAGAAGEGITAAGQNAEQVRQETPGGLLPEGAALPLTASGAMTGIISGAAGKLANKLGIGDVQTMLAQGRLGVVGSEAAEAAAKKGIFRKAAEGVISEGVLQELPQSYQEQVAQNIAQGKPWDEGAAKAGAQGMLSGALMGGGANVASHFAQPAQVASTDAAPVNQTPTGTTATDGTVPALGYSPLAGTPTVFPDGSVSLNGEQEFDKRYTPQPVKPSEAMGLNPNAGPMSAAATIAVDTGVHQTQIDEQQQQADQAQADADQMAYDAYTAQQEEEARKQDTIDKPITQGPLAEAAMSDDDKRAVLFSNQAVADGGIRHPGTQDGDILNGAGAPYSNYLAAARRAHMEGKDWVPQKIGDKQFVARRKDAANVSPDTGVQRNVAGTGNGGVSELSPSMAPDVGRGDVALRAVEPGRVADQPNTQNVPPAVGVNDAAVIGPTNEQNAAPGTEATPAAPQGQAPEAVGGQPAAVEQLSGARSAAVEANGVDQAAHAAATSPLNDIPQPTEAQKLAGNYAKGHLNLGGLDLSIENPAGSVRSGKDKSGKAWSNTLQHHYGYIKGTVGADKDHVDVFVKPGTPQDYSGQVFVVDQVHPDTGKWDEHKVVIGAKSGLEARRIYQANYAKGWKGLKSITPMTMDEFKTWLKNGNTKKPLAHANIAQAATNSIATQKEKPSAETAEAVKKSSQPEARAAATAVAEPTTGGGVAAEAKEGVKKPQTLAERVRAARAAKEAKAPKGGRTLRAAAYNKNPLMTFLATHGLFHDKDKPGSLKSEFSPDKAIMVMGYGPVFKKTGKRLDLLAFDAIEEGYLQRNGTEEQLRELIRRAVAGEKISPMYAEGVAEQFAEQSYAEHLAQQQEAAQDEDFDPFQPLSDLEYDLEDAANAGYDSASDPIKLEVNALLALAEDRGIDVDAIKEKAANDTYNDSEQAYYEAARSQLQEAIATSSGDSRANVGGQSAAQEGLTSPTREDVLAQREATERAGRAKKSAEVAADKHASENEDRKRIAKASESAANTFELGGDAMDNLTGQGGLFANEPMVSYNGSYETDLFGNQLPSASGKTIGAKSERAGVRRDVQPKPGIRDTQAPAGDYHVNTVVGTVSKREIGASRILTAQQAAQATHYLYRSAVERFDAIVTDRRGKPLAVVGGFKGATTQTSVYPVTVMAEAIRVPNAAYIWFSHNHPSGNSTLSRADENLNRTLSDVFRGSGIESMGTLAVSDGTFSHVGADGNIYASNESIGKSTESVKVPVMERELDTRNSALEAISDPTAAKALAKRLYEKANAPGIMLLTAQNSLAAWIPISNEMTGPLRNTGGLAAIYRAVSQSNAGAAIIVHGGELDGAWKNGLPNVSASENIAAALAKVDVRPLDSINAVTNESAAERGLDVAKGPMFSRTDFGTTSTVKEVQKAIRQLIGISGRNALGGTVATTAAEIKSTWQPLTGQNVNIESEGDAGRAQAYYDPKTDTAFMIADHIRAGTEMAVVAHELMHKHGKAVLGEAGWDRLHDVIGTWKNADIESDERLIYDAAIAKVRAVGMHLSNQELAPYAIEAALNADIKPNAMARQGTVQKWLANVIKSMKDVWAKVTGKPDLFKVQDLVDLAFAIAQRENPAYASIALDVGQNDAAKPDQTDTPAFRKWFGDSKVVNADGRPLVVYHGTGVNVGNRGEFMSGDFNTFDGGLSGKSSKTGAPDGSFFFTDKPDVASSYTVAWRGDFSENLKDGANVMPVYIAMSKPLKVNAKGENWREILYKGEYRDLNEIVQLAKESGKYDGVIVSKVIDKGVGATTSKTSTTYVAFDPTQIKSAIGNNGNFDGANPDIRFSRSIGDTLTSAANSVRDVNLPAGYKVADLINSAPGKLNWWHKTVGTQYNLAQRSPPFKRVYDAVQSFMNDVSFYATEAADLAPTILPKLENWRDIAKRPVSAVDTKAYSKPVFEGTLIWARDESGKLVKAEDLEATAEKLTPQQKAQRLLRGDHISESELKAMQAMPIAEYEKAVAERYDSDVLKAGVVFTDSELKSEFNLTPAQISLYREFRSATDESLTNLAIADMIRFGGEDVKPIADQVLGSKTVTEAADMMRDYLMSLAAADPKRNEVLTDTANRMIDKGDKAKDLMDRGYAPLSRFGKYTLDVVDTNGDRVYFGMFESAAEAAMMNRKMTGLYPGAKINQGTVSEQAYKLFAGVSPETLELFGDMLGLEAQGDKASAQAFQEYLKLAKSSRSAMKRLIQRKGIAGFSEDAGRVLAGFVYSNARQTATSLNMGEMAKSAADKEAFGNQGELQDAAVKLVDYIKNPQEEAQALRGLMFAQYIGGSVASAMVNMTQPITMTFPWLSQYGGAGKAAKQMTAAMKDSGKRLTGDTKLDAALRRAEEDGTVSPQEVHQLMKQSQGQGALRSGDGTRAGDALAKTHNALSKVGLAWGKLFSVAEQFNRRVTFIAAYRTAVDQGMHNPDAFARRAIHETQGVYNKGNKPAWARGAVGSTLFTFKQYSIAYVEMLSRMAKNGPEGKKAALLALGVLFLMSGASGMPGADDLDDLISGTMQAWGYNFDSKMRRKEFFVSLLGEGGAEFMERGVSGLPGVPIDVSGRMGLGNLIPGTGLFQKKTDHTRDVAEIAGPVGDFAKRTFDAAGKAVTGDVAGAATSLAPKAIQNLIQANDMANMGMYRDQTGKKVIDTDAGDALAKAIGFQPTDVKRVQDASQEAVRMIGLNKITETKIADRWAQGVFEKDPEKIQSARDDLADWNADNPESPIRINFKQIATRVHQMNLTKAERVAKTAPKEIRATVRQDLESAR